MRLSDMAPESVLDQFIRPSKKKKRKNLNSSSWSWIFVITLYYIQSTGAIPGELKASPLATQLTAELGSNTSLACASTSKPILCLWKTPYGHVYTLSEGVFAESGRLRHEVLSEAGGQGCGLQIVGVESKDVGDWQCEVGGIVSDAFETDTATISIDVSKKSESFQEGQTSRQEVGNDVILHCNSEREVHLCRWKTPYLNTYIVGEGIYVERGRIQWLGKDPNFDCTIRVAKLDLRDAGTWVCEIGSSTTETFQVQTKEFVIDIETPLKLSAPTSLMQNANTDATLVCHANKPYDDCLWTTPYGETYSFSDSSASHENGRIGYFGFAATDCGVIVRNVGSRDNGDWLCQLHSRNGDIFQNATDIVPLYADLTTAAKPRAIPDYDYDKKSSGGNLNAAYDEDYSEYSGDFSKVGNEPAAAQQAPVTKVQLFEDSSSKKPDSGKLHRTTPTVFSTSTDRIQVESEIELTKLIPTSTHRSAIGSPSSSTTERSSTSQSTQRSTFSTQRTTLASTPFSSSSTPRTLSSASTTTIAAPLSIFRDDGVELSGVNALELELLSRISGTRRDSRPIRIGAGQRGDQEAVNLAAEFESSRTDIPVVIEQVTERVVAETTTPLTPDTRERMRLREIQRIRDERKKTAQQREQDTDDEVVPDEGGDRKVDEAEQQAVKVKQEQEADRLRQMAIAREEDKKRQLELDRKRNEERQKQLEEQRKREEAEKRKMVDEDEARRKLEEAKKAEEEARRKFELAKQEAEEVKRKAERERIEKEREEERLRQINAVIEEEKNRAQEIERKRNEERQKQIEEQRKQEAEARKKKAEEDEARRKELKEKEEKEREEERQRQVTAAREEEKRRQREMDRKRLAERQKQLEEQRKKDEEEKRKHKEDEERKRIEKEQKEKEERDRIEAEKKEEAERLKIESEQNRIREEQKRRQQMEEERKRKREEELKLRQEAERRRKLEEEKAEIEKRKQEEREKARLEEEKRKAEEEKLQKEIEEKKKKENEEKLQKELEQKRREEEEKERAEAAKKKKEEEDKEREERRKKEEEDNRKRLREESLKREEERRRRLEAQQKREDDERAKKIEAERLKKLEEEEAKQKELERQKQDDLIKSQREEERRKALERKREEDRQKELQQRKLDNGGDSKKNVDETTNPDDDDDDNQDSPASRDPIDSSLNRDSTDSSSKSTSESPRSFPQNNNNNNVGNSNANGGQPITNLLPEKGRENERKHCVLPAFPSNGNVTCGNLLPEGDEYRLIYGQSCLLTCRAGFVSLELRESRCFNGRMTQRLECVPPDAMLIVGGRSDTYGVLSSVELVTGRGVCRGAVPPLPTMRWRMIAHAIDRERVIACGGVNIFGDPKADCWIMGFNPEPFWTEATRMNIARDAAAWAQEGNFLFVMGGSLGKLSGYTDSVEMYSVESGNWLEGPKMSTSRYSHCAVGLGNGSIIVTGGYGGLNMVERLDVHSAQWVNLPELNPVRAQHGCALVDLHGEHGVIVVGGDSGGTRLKDVRFLPIGPRHTEWRKVADMLTARWGRPGVGIVGGRITVAAGWNGVKDLDTVEYYDEVKREWRRQASRLQTERRWPSSTPISLFLFPKCAQRRE